MTSPKTRPAVQLELLPPDRVCDQCGSRLHDSCGYDPEAVQPVMSVKRALLETMAAHPPKVDRGRRPVVQPTPKAPGMTALRPDSP